MPSLTGINDLDRQLGKNIRQKYGQILEPFVSAQQSSKHHNRRLGASDRESQPNPNAAIAAMLEEYADLLQEQGDDGFRVKAYRRAANVVSTLNEPVSAILGRNGRQGLIDLPAVGTGIAGAIAEIVSTGRWAQLERLKGDLVPEALFRTLPGIGPELAHRIAEETQAETLEDLEQALHFDNVEIPGIGLRRMKMLKLALADRLGRRRGIGTSRTEAPGPPVSTLLEVDRMYREKAAAGELRKIAPKRFNPGGEAWLPILHARHDDWHFTALFSNTKRAHELGKTDDWVVIYYQQEGHPEGRATVVTQTSGVHAGDRVVRGREQNEEYHVSNTE